MAAYLKERDPNHLVTVGLEGFSFRTAVIEIQSGSSGASSSAAVIAALAILAVVAVVLQGLLAVARVPALVGWHLVAVVLGTATVAGAAWAGRGRGRLAVALVVAMTTVAPLLGVAAATGYRTIETDATGKPSTGTAEHGPWDGLTFPPNVAGMRARALEPGLDATVVYWGPTTPDDRGLAEGVPVGSAALASDMRPGYGYSSVGQALYRVVTTDSPGAKVASFNVAS